MFNLFKKKDLYEVEIKKLDKQFNSNKLRELPEYKIKALDIKKKHNKIGYFEYDLESYLITHPSTTDKEKEIIRTKLLYKYEKIDTIEYNKRINDLFGKPWAVIKTSTDENFNPNEISFEVDYNDTFIAYLKENKYNGFTNEEIIEDWLKDVCIANSGALDDEITSDVTPIVLNREKINNNNFIG